MTQLCEISKAKEDRKNVDSFEAINSHMHLQASGVSFCQRYLSVILHTTYQSTVIQLHPRWSFPVLPGSLNMSSHMADLLSEAFQPFYKDL